MHMLTDEPFTNEFKVTMREVVSGTCEFGLIPESEWSTPSWINVTKMEHAMAKMKKDGVIYGGSLSYRHMCR